MGQTTLIRRTLLKARKWQDVFPSSTSTGYAYPWEDIELKA
jgi:hypothetical protein